MVLIRRPWIEDGLDVSWFFFALDREWSVVASPSNEVDTATRLWGTSINRIEHTVIECVPQFAELGRKAVPKTPFMCSSGFSNVFKDEGCRLELRNAVYAHLGTYAPAFGVIDTLSLSQSRKGLTGESSNIEVGLALVLEIWVHPSIISYFKGVKVCDDELSWRRLHLGRTKQNVLDAAGYKGLRWRFHAREVSDQRQCGLVRLSWLSFTLV